LCSIDARVLICKISDFGLSRILDNSDESQSFKESLIPVKWSAPEMILKKKISTKSDVFSFGVVLFEVFSKGEDPWAGYSTFQVLESLIKKERMKFSKQFGPQFIIDLINECWKEDPHERPSFRILHEKLISEKQFQKKDNREISDFDVVYF